jgi:dephospho-CoA kinase
VHAEPVVYREEILTIMGVCAAIFGRSSRRSAFSSEATMARKKRKMTPEQRDELAEFRRRSNENLERLRELVERGWADLRAKRAAGYHVEHPAWGPPPR